MPGLDYDEMTVFDEMTVIWTNGFKIINFTFMLFIRMSNEMTYVKEVFGYLD